MFGGEKEPALAPQHVAAKGLLHGVPNTSTTRGYKTEYSRVCYERLRAHAATGGASTVDFRNSCSTGERGSLTPTLTLTLALSLTLALTCSTG